MLNQLTNTVRALLANGWSEAGVLDCLMCRADSYAQARRAIAAAKK